METGFGTGGYHSGVSGAEKAPQSYAIDPTQAGDMSRTVFGGMARGMAMSDDLLNSKIAEMQRQQQEAMGQELANVSAITDPNTRVQEMARLSVKYPSLAAPFKASQDMLGPIQQQARINRLMPVYAALNSGNTDAATKELQTQADALRNSGNETEAQSTENMIKTLQAGKVGSDSINTSTGMVLAGALGPEKFLENFMKIQKAPVDLAKEQAQTNEANAKADAARNPKPEKLGTIDQALNTYNNGQTTQVDARDKGFTAWYKDMTHPKAAAGAPSLNPAANASTAQERLAGVPSSSQALVKSVGTYKMMTTQLSPRQKNEIMGYVAQVFPNYSVGDAEANVKFVQDLAKGGPQSAGGAIGASERLLGHTAEALDLTDKLGDSRFGKIGNVVGQTYDTATGSGKAGYIKALRLTNGKIVAELNKLANGGVPEAKQLVEDIKNLSESDPTNVKYEVYKAAAALGLEQTHAIEARRDNLLGEFSPKTSLLSPSAQAAVYRIWKKTGSGDPNLKAPTTGSGYTTTAQNKETMGGIQKNPAPKGGATSVDDLMRLLGK